MFRKQHLDRWLFAPGSFLHHVLPNKITLKCAKSLDGAACRSCILLSEGHGSRISMLDLLVCCCLSSFLKILPWKTSSVAKGRTGPGLIISDNLLSDFFFLRHMQCFSHEMARDVEGGIAKWQLGAAPSKWLIWQTKHWNPASFVTQWNACTLRSIVFPTVLYSLYISSTSRSFWIGLLLESAVAVLCLKRSVRFYSNFAQP